MGVMARKERGAGGPRSRGAGRGCGPALRVLRPARPPRGWRPWRLQPAPARSSQGGGAGRYDVIVRRGSMPLLPAASPPCPTGPVRATPPRPCPVSGCPARPVTLLPCCCRPTPRLKAKMCAAQAAQAAHRDRLLLRTGGEHLQRSFPCSDGGRQSWGPDAYVSCTMPLPRLGLPLPPPQ